MKKIKLLVPTLSVLAIAPAFFITSCNKNLKQITYDDLVKDATKKYTEVFSKYTKAQLEAGDYKINSSSFLHDWPDKKKVQIKKENTAIAVEDKGGERPEAFIMVNLGTSQVGFYLSPSLTGFLNLISPQESYYNTYYETNSEWIIKIQEKQPSGTYLQDMEYHLNKSNGIMMSYVLKYLDPTTKSEVSTEQVLIFDSFVVGK